MTLDQIQARAEAYARHIHRGATWDPGYPDTVREAARVLQDPADWKYNHVRACARHRLIIEAQIKQQQAA